MTPAPALAQTILAGVSQDPCCRSLLRVDVPRSGGRPASKRLYVASKSMWEPLEVKVWDIGDGEHRLRDSFAPSTDAQPGTLWYEASTLVPL
jgi:hypothetical protein